MKVGTRKSELALRQTDIFLNALRSVVPGVDVEVVQIRSLGDIDPESPLDKFQDRGVFVGELDLALLSGEIDVAINSMKDMPVDIHEDLCVPAVLPRADVRDVCIPCSLESLKYGATVGTSSIRRTAMLKDVRPDVKVKLLRGNVRTRISKLDSGQYDAIILSKAGIDRLDIDRPMSILDPEIFVPAPAQGAIAAVCRRNDRKVIDLLRRINDNVTYSEVTIERYLMKLIGAGCSSPIGINAKVIGDKAVVNSVYFGTGTKTSFKSAMTTGCSRLILKDAANALCGRSGGHVYLIGAGPGDRDLITVKGIELLRSAEVVVYDALIDLSLLDECPAAELINVGKRSNNHVKTQTEINELLIDCGKRGKRVIRLKGGDPFLFGRGAEEVAALRMAGVPVTVVPGVSSSIAVPELVGIPVTHRNYASSVTILTGHNKFGGTGIDWAAAARMGGTLVIMMGMSNAATISKKLMENGKPPQTEVAIISSGTKSEQCTVTTTLDKLAEAICENNLKAPGIIVVGSAVSERKKLGDLC